MDERCKICQVVEADLDGCASCDRLVCDSCGSFDVQGHLGALVCMVCAKRLSGVKAQCADGAPAEKEHKDFALADTIGHHSSGKGFWPAAWSGPHSKLVAWRNSLWAVLHIYIILLATGLATMFAYGLFVNTGAAVGGAVNTMASSTGEAVGHSLGRTLAARVMGSQVLQWVGIKEAVMWSAGLDTMVQLMR
jgi:hypothetical protein